VSASGARKVVEAPPLSLFPARAIWTLALNNPLTVDPAYDREHVYFAIEGDRFLSYTMADGTQQWLVEARPLTQPAVADGLIVAPERDGLVARSTGDGSVAWRTALPDPLSAPPVAGGGAVVVVTTGGAVLSFRATDGQRVWLRDIKSPAHATLARAGDRVYVPTADGRVVALRVDTGEPAWERRLGDAANDLLVLDDRIYVGSQDNFLYCLMTKTGRVDWRWRTGGDVIGVPAVDEARVYFVSLDNVLRGLDRVTGGQEWMRPLPVRPVWGPVVVREKLIVGGQSATLSAFNVKDGSASEKLEAGAEVGAAPHVIADAGSLLPEVLVVTRDLAKGAAAKLVTRRLEPQTNALTDPLPNVIKMSPGQPTK
jgi:outer membrane protein assembly factor BamB